MHLPALKSGGTYRIIIFEKWKGMNPTILPPAMGNIIGQTELFNFSMVTDLRERNLQIQISCKLEEKLTLPVYSCPPTTTTTIKTRLQGYWAYQWM